MLRVLTLCLFCFATATMGAQPPTQTSATDFKAGLYIVEFNQQPLSSGASAKQRSDRKAAQRQTLTAALGGKATIEIKHHYLHALDGVAVALSAEQAQVLNQNPRIHRMTPSWTDRLLTDAGPGWIGAPSIWSGQNGTASRGRGQVIGIIDTGVNWNHPSFASVDADGVTINNPRGQQFGLCSDPAVRCNDKLIGVYDYTDEGTKGFDNDGHGTHVASTAAGNVVNGQIVAETIVVDASISGVAPRANLITYKVCTALNPANPDAGTCAGEAILAAIDQAVANQVDVLNLSLGGSARDPWRSPDAQALLNARRAGAIVVAAAGNEGPDARTVSSPANFPWVVAVGNSTHDRSYYNALVNLTGGTNPPDDLVGEGLSDGFGPARIVHARDFGNALCGQGPAELQPTCDGLGGTSNPFPPGTFNGEIVVCDRGTYGRVEKGFNLLLAGAGGYVLVNTDNAGETTVSDDHCLPAVHLGAGDGDRLRTWLNSAGTKTATISGVKTVTNPTRADRLVNSSARGLPVLPINPLSQISLDLVKPELVAPGSNILAAGPVGDELAFLTGTSMASPHVAGSFALLRAANPSRSNASLISAMMLSAQTTVVDNATAAPADVVAIGAGRVDLAAAQQATLFTAMSVADFDLADPAAGGDLSSLNFPAMAEDDCDDGCSFARDFTGLAAKQWQVSIDTDDVLAATATPAAFAIGANGTQTVTFDVSACDASQNFAPVQARVGLRADDGETLQLPLAVSAEPCDIPTRFEIVADAANKRLDLTLQDFPELSVARFEGSQVAAAIEQTFGHRDDRTANLPFDNADSVGITALTLSQPSNLVVLTQEQTGGDIDIYVGLDRDGSGGPTVGDDGELIVDQILCRSMTPGNQEFCVLPNLAAGSYWIAIHSFAVASTTSRLPQPVGFEYALIPSSGINPLFFDGPSQVSPARRSFDAVLGYNNVALADGDVALGYVSVIPDAVAEPVFRPVRLIGTDEARTTVPQLVGNQRETAFVVPAASSVDQLFFDVPPGTQSVSLQLQLDGNGQVSIRHLPTSSLPTLGLGEPVGAPLQVVDTNGDATLELLTPAAGRYFVSIDNPTDSTRAGTLRLASDFGGQGLSVQPGAWLNAALDSQGVNFDYAGDGATLILGWFTFDDLGLPTWFTNGIALAADENRAEGAVFQPRRDGATTFNGQAAGTVVITPLANDQLAFVYEVAGRTGAQLITPQVGRFSCPNVNGPTSNVGGTWFDPVAAGFGWTVLGVQNAELIAHFYYDSTGLPRWAAAAQSPFGQSNTFDLVSFTGRCPFCGATATTSQTVGFVDRSYANAREATISSDIMVSQPFAANWQVGPTNIIPISDPQPCQ